MAMTKRKSKNDNIILNTIEQLVPQDHDAVSYTHLDVYKRQILMY